MMSFQAGTDTANAVTLTVAPPQPWWRRLWAWLAYDPAADLAASHLERLHEMLTLHRDLRLQMDRAHGLSEQLRRARDWNTALIKEKDALVRTVAGHERQHATNTSRLDEAGRAVVDANERCRILLEEIEGLKQERDQYEVDLRGALGKCQDLTRRLRDHRKGRKR